MSTPARRVAFHTIGCKLNFAETATISRDFIQHGFEKVDFREPADVYVINTCSVTDNADKDCRKVVRQVKRRSPDAFVALVGCYAQLRPKEVAAIPGVDAVLGAKEKFDLFGNLDSFEKKPEATVYCAPVQDAISFSPSFSSGERTRAFLKVQDGCDYKCSFCTIPMARGSSRSNSVAETMAVARQVAATEAQEIVLTGVNIGDFGSGGDETFLDLIRELDMLNGIERIRISSIEPNLLSDDIIQFVESSRRFVPHFHLPLQSGSNRVLKAMQRRYRRELFAERVQQIKTRLPEACIGVDVIVGFPTETEDAFRQTYMFLNELDISYLHVFSYSERPGTAALDFPSVVSREERAERSKQLHILSEKKRRHYQEQFIGKSLDVLFESQVNGIVQGHTANYVRVTAAGEGEWVNRIVPVQLEINRGSDMSGSIRVN